MRRGVAERGVWICATMIVVLATVLGATLSPLARGSGSAEREMPDGMRMAAAGGVDGGAYFIQNVGQYPDEVVCYAEARGGRLWVLRGRIVLQLVEPGGPSDASALRDDPAPCPPKALFEVDREANTPSAAWDSIRTTIS